MLGARRDGSASVDTSRGLLLTVLGEFVLPTGRSAWTQTLVAAMESLGVRDKAARQALARMEDRGWLSRERFGRQTRWSLTDESTELLTVGAERIYSFGQVRREWDQRWVVLLASVPEPDRAARYRMAQGLGWAGFGSLGQGTWLSPWTDREPAAVELLAGLGVDGTSFIGGLGAMGSARDIAGKAWSLPDLHVGYDSFLADTERLAVNPPSGAAAAAALTGVVHRWRRFPFLDPDLPAALLPDGWPGPESAQRFAGLRAALSPSATAWWRELDDSHAPPTWTAG